jgi:cell division protein FtsZ
MGGGTGTGAAPVIARAARSAGILTVAVVTKPFAFEGTHRMQSADTGIEQLRECADTVIVVPNQNLFRLANERTTLAEAFAAADHVLHAGVSTIIDLIVKDGLINLDFADVRSVMSEMGKAMMGTGEAGGDNRAIEAAEQAIANPLLDGVSMKGAKGVIISITGGEDMRLMEVDEAANHIRELVDPDANIIWGSAFNNDLDGKIRVSVVATGIGAEEVLPMPEPAKVFAFPAARAASEAARTEAVAEEAPAATPITLTAPDEIAAETVAEAAAEPDEMMLDESMAETTEGPSDELLLGDGMTEADMAETPQPATRAWLTEESAPAAEAKPVEAPRSSGTLFERMSSIARGAQKAQVPEAESEDSPRLRTGTRDPLDIPRFLNRQNNQ